MVEEILGEIWRWVLINVNVEAAIVAWKRAGKPLWLTLIAMEGVGAANIVVSYASFSVLFLIGRYLLGLLGRFSFLQKQYRALRQSVHLNARSFLERLKGSKRFLGKHQKFILFFVNLIPASSWGLILYNFIPLPYFTLATIVVAKTAKVRWGLFCILAGNAIKILAEVRGFYWI